MCFLFLKKKKQHIIVITTFFLSAYNLRWIFVNINMKSSKFCRENKNNIFRIKCDWSYLNEPVEVQRSLEVILFQVIVVEDIESK